MVDVDNRAVEGRSTAATPDPSLVEVRGAPAPSHETPAPDSGDRPPRPYLLTTLALLTTITAITSSLGAPLVPSVVEHFDVRLTTAQWSLTAALLAGAVSTPVVGRFASGRVRRPTILAGLATVLLGTVLAAAAVPLESFALLVAARALQGIGMSLVPLAMAVARDELAGAKQSRAIALLSVTMVAGAGLGYPLTALMALIGGLVAAYALGAVLTVVSLVLALRFVPGAPGVEPARVDWLGAAGLTVAMLATLLAVSEGEVWGWDDPRTLGLGAVGLLGLAGWTAYTLGSRHPLVDLRLAVRPGIAAPNLVAVIAGVGMYSLLTLVVVLVRADPASDPGGGFGLDESVLAAGMVLVPYSLMSVLGNQLARLVLARVGRRTLLPAGSLMFMSATLALAVWHDHLWQALAVMALGGLGSGFTFSSLAVLMVPHVPAAETGSAMAFNQVLRYLGFTTGSAVSVALMAAYGGGETGFRAALFTIAGIWVVAIAGALLLDRRPSPVVEQRGAPATSGRRDH
ncbi:MAG: MFS transporter [Actinobacteria bacterium]|nr:MFS transporter [Actinomycetota bacterium]